MATAPATGAAEVTGLATEVTRVVGLGAAVVTTVVGLTAEVTRVVGLGAAVVALVGAADVTGLADDEGAGADPPLAAHWKTAGPGIL